MALVGFQGCDPFETKSFVREDKTREQVEELQREVEGARITLPVCPRPSAIPNLRLNKGTTTLAFRFKEGILCAVDSRASQGAYVASSTVFKVLPINEYLLGTMAGGAADCQYWLRVLWQECRMWELKNRQRVTVRVASKILSDITFHYKRYGLSIGSMVMGWDKTGSHLYMVDDQGTRIKDDLFSVGSGSIYAYGVLDANYKYDMTVEEAAALGKKAIMHAIHRDAASGGYIQVYHVHKPDENGNAWTRLSRGDGMDVIYDAFEKGTMAKLSSTDP